jgi:hypothetical protein
MPTTPPAQPGPTRPLYLKKVPTAVWEQVHVNAIRSGMRFGDYLVAVLAAAEPIPSRPTPAARSAQPPSAG